MIKGKSGGLPGKTAKKKRDRLQKRIKKRYPIHFGLEKPSELGFINNLSRSGVAISAKKSYAPGSKLKMLIQFEHQLIQLDGMVRWRTEGAGEKVATMEMGVMFITIDENYVQLLEKIIHELGQKRIEARFEQELKVTFVTPNELFEEYTNNISQGGLFVCTDRNFLAENSVVVVKMYILDILEEISMECRVIFTLTPELAQEKGRKPGMGLEILAFSNKEDRDKFYAYINELKEKQKTV